MASGIANTNTLDVITHDQLTGEYALIMVASEPWTAEQVLALQAKTKAYLMFLENGQVFQHYPEIRGKPIRFQLDTSHPASAIVRQFIERATAEWLTEFGIRFTIVELT